VLAAEREQDSAPFVFFCIGIFPLPFGIERAETCRSQDTQQKKSRYTIKIKKTFIE
jgi:hypothetical protein